MMLTIEQAADRLGVSQKTIRGMLPDLGALDLLNGKSKKRLIRIPEDKLDAYLSSCRIVASPEPQTRTRRKNESVDLSLFEPDGRIKRRHHKKGSIRA